MAANNPKYLIIHHEFGSNGFDGVNAYHRQLWNFKSSLGWHIGYHYYISKSGKIHQGRADTDEGAHCLGRNFDSLGICLEGNLDSTRPTDFQLASLKKLILEKMTQWAILPQNIYGHRVYANYKTCPGLLLKESEIKTLFQPDTGYYRTLLDSLKELLLRMRQRLGGGQSTCIGPDSRG